MKKILWALACAALLFASCGEEAPGLVKVRSGKVQGVVTEGLTIYKGIPFAAPPVGDLRWKAPQREASWDTVLVADHFAPGAMQGGHSPVGFSEDCLYLNVWTPAASKKDKLPVLVWIYGGGFAGGHTADPNYDCEALARKGGIVMVSVAYRVGKLGFLAHPELSAENPQHVSGNYGLLDQIAALQWVQENIAQFGGDPDKVTIFGESAGGISVSQLCASPLAAGLFRGAISQSGGSFGPTRPTTYPGENMKTLSDAEKDGLKIAESLGASSLAEMRALDASAFVTNGLSANGGGWPIVDGYVIPGDQYELYEQGRYNDVAVLIGYNTDEDASFGGLGGASTPEGHIAGVQKRYGKFAEDLLAAYPLEDGKVGKQARDLMRDAAFGWQTWAWGCLQAKTGKSPVYMYYFDQHPEYPEDSPRYGYGSPHGQDVAYVFQHMENSRMKESDLPLSDAMGQYWINFTKYGDPNGEGLPKWPRFMGEDDSQYMYLTGPEPFAGPVPSLESLKVLDAYFAWRRTDEGKAASL